jgi:hypothetical protein
MLPKEGVRKRSLMCVLEQQRRALNGRIDPIPVLPPVFYCVTEDEDGHEKGELRYE